MDEAVGFIEFNSVAAGIFATDAMAKKAEVEIIDSRSVCPGKYIILISGMTGPVDESLQAGIEAGWIGFIVGFIVGFVVGFKVFRQTKNIDAHLCIRRSVDHNQEKEGKKYRNPRGAGQ